MPGHPGGQHCRPGNAATFSSGTNLISHQQCSYPVIPMHNYLRIIAMFPLGFALLANAADEDLLQSFGEEDFVSIATGQQQTLSQAPAVATVITASQIEAMGAANLDQVLETVPGLHVSISTYRFSPIYSMRGIHTDKNPQVLMLVNGIPLTQLYFGDRGGNNTLPVSNIARVEVIRGPGSAIYGADAFAGVINVTTKSSQQIDGTQLGVRAGSFDSQELWLLQGSQLGEVELAFSLDVSKTTGDSNRIIEADTQSAVDQQSGGITSASLAPGAADTDQKRIDLRLDLSWNDLTFSVWNWQQKGGVGPGLALALDHDGSAETNNWLVDLAYNNRDSVESWEFAGVLSYMDINTKSEQTLFPAGTVLPLGADGNVDPMGKSLGFFPDGVIGNPEIYEEHIRADTNAYFTGFERHTLRLAAGLNYARLHGEESKNYGPGVIEPVLAIQTVDGSLTSVSNTPYIFIPEESRRVYYGSLQDEWLIAADWKLTVGVRYDNYSDFGSTTNPRAALVWNTRSELTTKLLYGRAFRAPSFAELFNINNPIALGNPDLSPETIDTYELAFDYRPTYDLRTGLNLFYYHIEDLIRFVPDADTGANVAQNAEGQTGYGFEFEVEWALLDSLELAAHYAYQHSQYDDLNADVGNAPGQQLYGELRWEFAPEWEFNTQAKWIGNRKRDFGDPRADIDSYTLLDLVLRRKNIANHLDVALIVQNALDADAYEPSPGEPRDPNGSQVPGDFPLAGRGYYITLGYQF